MKRLASRIICAAAALSLAFPHAAVVAQSTAEYEAKLREEEARLQAEVAALSKDVTRIQGQKSSIEQAIALIDAQIKEAEAKIRLRTLTIEGLTKDIGSKAKSIEELEGRLERSQASLANLVRRTNENDDMTLPELLLTGQDFSEFFVSVDSFQTIKNSLNALREEVKAVREQTSAEKATLEDRKAKEADARAAIEAERKVVQAKKAEQAELLRIKNGELKTYQQWVSERQARISQIRSTLFELRGTAGIPFGDAYDYAVEASKVTGVRVAYILAILQQESDMGKNVGTCNRPGDPVSKKYTAIMPGPIHYANYLANKKSCIGAKSPCSYRDDQTVFKELMTKLGRDPEVTPLSCPIASVGGWGGAMGPSQFIPTTWKAYESKIASAVGVKIPDPWNPYHAIMATALFMKDLGASGGTYTAERTAACRYYSGGTCSTTAVATYGNQVMTKAANIQTNMINPILGQ